MPTYKDKSVRKINKTTSGSYYITIPIDLIEELGWKKGQKVRVQKYGQHIAVRDWKAKGD